MGLETCAPLPALIPVNTLSERSPRLSPVTARQQQPPLKDAYRNARADGRRGARRGGAPGRAVGHGQGKRRFAAGCLTRGSERLPSSESGALSSHPACFWPLDAPGSHKQGSSTARQRAEAPRWVPWSRAARQGIPLNPNGKPRPWKLHWEVCPAETTLRARQHRAARWSNRGCRGRRQQHPCDKAGGRQAAGPSHPRSHLLL